MFWSRLEAGTCGIAGWQCLEHAHGLHIEVLDIYLQVGVSDLARATYEFGDR